MSDDRPAPEINFGRIARTINYKDSQGSLVFTFDVESSQPDSKGVWTLVLDSGAVLRGQFTSTEDASPEQATWIRSARDVVIAYLRSRPYHVIDAERTNKT